MDILWNLVGNNFVVSELIAVAMIIGGAGIAFGRKEGNRWGWLVLFTGVGLGAFALHVKGLV